MTATPERMLSVAAAHLFLLDRDILPAAAQFGENDTTRATAAALPAASRQGLSAGAPADLRGGRREAPVLRVAGPAGPGAAVR